MPILLDIGNTAVTYGVYHGGRMLSSGSATEDDIPKLSKKWSSSGRPEHSECLISSVVPKMTLFLKRALRSKGPMKIWVLGQDIKPLFPHKYRPLKTLGMDRRVNIYGALRMYKPPLLIIDFGTAITADYVSKKGVFEGGMIIPGPELAYHSLIKKAALLPRTLPLPRRAPSLTARNTYGCLQSGVLHGFAAMTEGIIDRFRSERGTDLKVILTGGYAQHLVPYMKGRYRFDPKHSIKSLLMIYKDCACS